MKNKTNITMLLVGVGGTLLYQQLKSGNLQKMVKKMNKAKVKAMDNLEDMI